MPWLYIVYIVANISLKKIGQLLRQVSRRRRRRNAAAHLNPKWYSRYDAVAEKRLRWKTGDDRAEAEQRAPARMSFLQRRAFDAGSFLFGFVAVLYLAGGLCTAALRKRISGGVR